MKYANITAFQNSYVNSLLTFKNDNGTVMNVTGYLFELVISKHNESVNKIVFELPVEDAAAGEVSLEISSAETLTIPVGANVYSIFGTHATHGTLLFQQGTFFMQPTNYVVPAP